MWKKNVHNNSRVLGKINKLMKSSKFRPNNGSKTGVIIMELFKAFDSLNYELLLDKIKTYGLDNNSLVLHGCIIEENWLTPSLSIFFFLIYLFIHLNTSVYILMIQNKSVIRILSQYK